MCSPRTNTNVLVQAANPRNRRAEPWFRLGGLARPSYTFLVTCRGARLATLFVFLMAVPALAQTPSRPRAVVLDQTNLPLPGVRIDVFRGDQVIQSTITAGDGTFELLPGPATDMVEATLEGFETIRVPRATADRIVLAIAHATDVTEVVA